MAATPIARAARRVFCRDSAGAGLPVSMWALLLVVALLPTALYGATAWSMVTIWSRSETFAHGYLIAPISCWLIWQRRAQLGAIRRSPYWPALLPLAACGALWLLAQLGQVQVVCQYAFVAMIPLTALALMGPRMALSLAFPLLFLLLAVPVGDSLIEPLMRFTANFAVGALRLSGLPVLHEGSNFTLPSGSWSVVEACSGLRYLVASVTVGVLYAQLAYTVLWKRLFFVAVATLLPILANGLRAYLIVMLGHLSDMTVAVGVDHLLYGWLFFGIVMFALLSAGARWRDPLPLPAVPSAAPAAAPVAMHGWILLAVTLVLGVWPAGAALLERPVSSAAPAGLASFRAKAPPGTGFTDWQAAYGAPAATLRRYYLQQGQQLGLSLLYYRAQHAGSKLISSTNRLTSMVNSPWNLRDTDIRHETVHGRRFAIRESTLVSEKQTLLVWSWYWIDHQVTVSDAFATFLQLKQKLGDGFDDGATVMLFASSDEMPAVARAALRSFLEENQQALDATLQLVRSSAGARP